MSAPEYQVLETRRLYAGRVISLRADAVQMSDGSVSTREIVEHPGAVAIVAIDADDQLVVVRQYRAAIGTYLLELPAGLLDVADESALACAQRELFEETALRAKDWNLLVDLLPSPGMSDEAVRIYLARQLVEVAAIDRYRPEHEEITMSVSRVSLDEAVALVFASEIRNATAIAGILAAKVAHSLGWRDLRSATTAWADRPTR